MLICLIQRNQIYRDYVMHEFSSNVNKENKAIINTRTIAHTLCALYPCKNIFIIACPFAHDFNTKHFIFLCRFANDYKVGVREMRWEDV